MPCARDQAGQTPTAFKVQDIRAQNDIDVAVFCLVSDDEAVREVTETADHIIESVGAQVVTTLEDGTGAMSWGQFPTSVARPRRRTPSLALGDDWRVPMPVSRVRWGAPRASGGKLLMRTRAAQHAR